MSRICSPPAARQQTTRTSRFVAGTLASLFVVAVVTQGCADEAEFPDDAEAWEGMPEDDDDDAPPPSDEDDSDTGPEDDSDTGPDGPPPDDPPDDPPPGDPPPNDPPPDDPPPDDPPPTSDEVPDNAYCSGVADWDPTWSILEEEILVIVNERRAEGANCGSEGSFPAAPPLTMESALRCAARVHSKDMADRGFFDHTNPSGEAPWDRMAQAGYSYSSAGENIAGGNSTAADTMQQWMDSDGHCSNIMSDNFTEIGVGYHPGGQWGHLWTQAFGRP